ncbi:hypothetical protein BASA81_006557 [Batrachochytrium salamandrivorans]|nr:hypothetical protein BASA81_006557 [Batrachochytrium salamandrivorans]
MDQERTIRVSGLSPGCGEFKVRNYFVPFGPIDSVAMDGGGACAVQFKFASDALEAANNADGAEFEGDRVLQVRIAKPASAGKQARLHHRQQAVWATNM